VNELVYLNGSLVSRDEARISPLDYGFLYGFGLFETMRAYEGKVFCLGRHLERLAYSAKRLGITVETEVLEGAVNETVRANGLDNARIRLTVSGGEGGAIPDLASCTEPTILVVATHYKPFADEIYRNGFRAITSSFRLNATSPISGMKSLNYLESLLARQEARTVRADEALFINDRGLLAEASMSNIFLVSDGSLKTPGQGSGFLPGITRAVVKELAAGLGIGVEECDLMPEDAFHAQEAFLTNSIMELMPLTEVDGRPVGDGKPGPVTLRLMAAYRKAVWQETGGNESGSVPRTD